MRRPRIRLVARFGTPGRGLSPYVMVSLAAHAVFAGLVILIPSLRPSPAFPDSPLVVDLVAAATNPATAPVQATPQPPPVEPEPVERPDAAHLETQPVKPAPDKPDPPPEKKKKPEPPAPAPGGPGPAGDEAGAVMALEGGDIEFAWYRASVTAALYSHWRKPVLERMAEPYEVRVVFEILRDGTVRGLEVEISSGVPSLDRSALRAISDAAPLPPLPQTYRDTLLPAGFVFRLYPE